MRQYRAIVKDEGVMLGKPTVAGTRLTVELILEKLAAGEGVGQIVESYPRLDRESVREALLFAAGACGARDGPRERGQGTSGTR